MFVLTEMLHLLITGRVDRANDESEYEFFNQGVCV